MKNTPLFHQTATALITPFTNGKIDFAALSRLIEYQLEGGVKTIVLCGTTGESATLTPSEKQSLFSFAGAEYGNHATLIAGCGTCDTMGSLALTHMASASGVHGILAVTPYYNKPSAEGLYQHYKALSRATDLPIIVYQVPGRTGIRIAADLWKRLSALPNIVGLKDAGGDIAMSARYLNASDIPVYSGNDDSIVPLMSIGGMGCISVISNLMPARIQAMTEAAEAGDTAKAAKIQLSILPLVDALFSQTNPIPVKWALSRLGFCRADWRLPLTEPSEETKRLLEREMEAADLL
ncbi:MAG: 4-hydroxy-tetrahydrodipicolinate synthase [Ruminococcaceae bacterium]|nr:4-hydroxy-tetrahydrodipicolinate synthase [Oscillospiraceae bacterium]